MKKIEFLFSGNFDVNNYPRHYKARQVEEVSDKDAERLIADKCAKLYIEKPKKVKDDNKNNK